MIEEFERRGWMVELQAPQGELQPKLSYSHYPDASMNNLCTPNRSQRAIYQRVRLLTISRNVTQAFRTVTIITIPRQRSITSGRLWRMYGLIQLLPTSEVARSFVLAFRIMRLVRLLALDNLIRLAPYYYLTIIGNGASS